MLAGRAFEVLGAATGDVAALRQTLNTAEPGAFRVDYGQLMRSLDGLLRAAELPVVHRSRNRRAEEQHAGAVRRARAAARRPRS